ncbi:MAG: hypothetical protein J6Z46_12275 [Lachnospiraceae bacterium]|nr:hypothetical protein [Lachnospiraceae bacterium]
MGFFDFLKFKKRKAKNARTESTVRAFSESALADRSTRESYITSNCEVITSAEKQTLESRKEYEVVTSYLSDIQRIDLIPEDERQEINESAERIINLNKERLKMTHTPSKITMAQRLAIEESDADMDEEIQRIADSEAYKLMIESDQRMIEGERDAYDYEINDAVNRDEFYRKVMIIATVFVGISLIFLILVRGMEGMEDRQGLILLVFALIVLFGGGMAAYFVVNHKRIEKELKENTAKLNRAIYLLNKVNIKYVNVVNMLDYNYEKYHVLDLKELKYNWKEYKRLLEEEKRFKKAEQLIEFYNDDLKHRLAKAGVQDCGIWIYQCEALTDPKEMVEVRHRLNVRRQKLRKAIDYNTKQAEQAMLQLRTFVEKHPEYEYETKMFMDRYRLTLEQ